MTTSTVSPALVKIWVRSLSPLIQERRVPSTKPRLSDPRLRTPLNQALRLAHATEDGDYGIPTMALASSLRTACEDLGIDAEHVFGCLSIKCDDANGLIPIDANEPTVREDVVRDSRGSVGVLYRPMWTQWNSRIEFVADDQEISIDSVKSLINRAGFGVGICACRPELGGEFGRFEVDPTQLVVVHTNSHLVRQCS